MKLFPGAVKDKCVDRKLLAKIIFDDRKARKQLEYVMHRPIAYKFAVSILFYWILGYQEIILDVPLLYETGLDRWMSYTIVIFVNKSEQLKRIQKRDGYDETSIKRIEAQISVEEKCKRADVVIENERTIEDLYLQLDNTLARRRRNSLGITLHMLVYYYIPVSMILGVLVLLIFKIIM